jgi:hypothetical protein
MEPQGSSQLPEEFVDGIQWLMLFKVYSPAIYGLRID